MENLETNKKNWVEKSIHFIEYVGNKFPHPFYLFGILFFITIFLSFVLHKLGFNASYLDKTAGSEAMKVIEVVNLLTFENLRDFFSNVPSIYAAYPPLGLTIIMMMSIGLVETTGFFHAIMRKYLLDAPKPLITAALVFIGINANIMSDAGTILTFTLGGILYASIGRNPKLGIIVGFASCSGGFTANMFVTSTDALLAGITQSAVSSLGMEIIVSPLANYYFMAVSTIFLTLTITFLTEKFMVKWIGNDYVQPDDEDLLEKYRVTPEETRGLKFSLFSFLAFLVILLGLSVPANAFFRSPDNTFLPTSPLLSSIVIITFFMFCFIGIAYGVGAGTIKKAKDIPVLLQAGVSKSMPLLVTILTAASFLYMINKSNIFRIVAVKLSDTLRGADVSVLMLLFLVILITALINPFVTSGSTKWIILAPMVVPMLALLDVNPAFAQLAFRIGDSATNIISPIRADIPIILGLFAQYDAEIFARTKIKKTEAGFGTLFSMTLPYSIVILFTMVTIMTLWYFSGLPIGPGVDMFLK